MRQAAKNRQYNNMSCEKISCYGQNSCCQIARINDERRAYCTISSQCQESPFWETITIPSVIGLFAIIIAIVVCYKIRQARLNPMKVTNFAAYEIQIPKLSYTKTKMSSIVS